MSAVSYIQAISDGLREEMRRDERVFCLGEDIGTYGGAFRVTRGFLEEFGRPRTLDTPLSESAILGASVGAAMMGLRPVAEMQFADFVANGFNMLVNFAAKAHYRWRARVPMVVRLPTGGGTRGGPFHSTNCEAWFTRVPGLKVVAP
ncbi:MAG: alpha-ketoacid dehydrogenase subunit beta, partial [Planctomycetota bacterium]